MTNPFWNGETYAIVKAMKAAGNRPGIIAQWKADMEQWAAIRPATDRDAQAVRSWLPHWQVRPMYTAEELAPIWPALAIAIGHTDRWPAVPKSASRLGFELDYAGLPRLPGPLECPTGTQGTDFSRYFVVERIHYWTSLFRTLEEIENAIYSR